MVEVETPSLSSRCQVLKPSPTLGISARAKSIPGVISFTVGEPDFNTPAPICQAAIDALWAGQTKYTVGTGIPQLKEAIANKLQRENQVHVEPSQVVVSCGAKHSLFQTMMVLLDPGDEVILLAPYWMTYEDQVLVAGGKPVIVPSRADEGFIPDLDRVKAAITPKTKAIVINSPGNPTGAVYPRETIKELAALALRHNLWIIADEIYERLIYGDAQHQSIAALSKELADRTITIGGCSKSFAMTGWRIGFAAAPKPLVPMLSNLQDQITSNPTSFAQYGAVAAYNMDPSVVEEMRVQFDSRRQTVLTEIARIPNVKLVPPKGAFYVLPDFSAYIGGEFADDLALCEHLITNAKVATIPGSVFGAPGHLRISYATNEDVIREGIGRIAEALAGVPA